MEQAGGREIHHDYHRIICQSHTSTGSMMAGLLRTTSAAVIAKPCIQSNERTAAVS